MANPPDHLVKDTGGLGQTDGGGNHVTMTKPSQRHFLGSRWLAEKIGGVSHDRADSSPKPVAFVRREANRECLSPTSHGHVGQEIRNPWQDEIWPHIEKVLGLHSRAQHANCMRPNAPTRNNVHGMISTHHCLLRRR